MKPIKLILLFLLMLSLSLVMTLPASLIVAQVKLDKELQFGAIQGPWWSFSVDWLSFRGITQGETTVKFVPICLLSVSACFDVDNKHAHISFKKSLLNNSLSIEKSNFSISFEQLSPVMTSLFVKPTGSLTINISSLQWADNTLVDLSAKVNWLNVGVQGEDFDLGSVQAQVTHQPEWLTINLSDQSDKLDLSGTVKISKKGIIDSNVQLTTLSRFPNSLKSILQGVMVKRGKDIFEYKSKLNNRLIKQSNINF